MIYQTKNQKPNTINHFVAVEQKKNPQDKEDHQQDNKLTIEKWMWKEGFIKFF